MRPRVPSQHNGPVAPLRQFGPGANANHITAHMPRTFQDSLNNGPPIPVSTNDAFFHQQSLKQRLPALADMPGTEEHQAMLMDPDRSLHYQDFQQQKQRQPHQSQQPSTQRQLSIPPASIQNINKGTQNYFSNTVPFASPDLALPSLLVPSTTNHPSQSYLAASHVPPYRSNGSLATGPPASMKASQALQSDSGMDTGIVSLNQVLIPEEFSMSMPPLIDPHPSTNPQGGPAFLRLLQYADALGAGPSRMDLAYWKSFVNAFFSSDGSLTYTLSNATKQHKRQFCIPPCIIPRFYHSAYLSGLRSTQLILHSVRESVETDLLSQSAPHYRLVESPRVSWIYNYANGTQVIATGGLRAAFVPDSGILKIISLEFDTENCVEYIARAALARERILIKDSPIGLPLPRPYITEHLKLPESMTNEYGIGKPSMRYLEIADSVLRMKHLMLHSITEKVGPTAALRSIADQIRYEKGLSNGFQHQRGAPQPKVSSPALSSHAPQEYAPNLRRAHDNIRRQPLDLKRKPSDQKRKDSVSVRGTDSDRSQSQSTSISHHRRSSQDHSPKRSKTEPSETPPSRSTSPSLARTSISSAGDTKAFGQDHRYLQSQGPSPTAIQEVSTSQISRPGLVEDSLIAMAQDYFLANDDMEIAATDAYDVQAPTLEDRDSLQDEEALSRELHKRHVLAGLDD